MAPTKLRIHHIIKTGGEGPGREAGWDEGGGRKYEHEITAGVSLEKVHFGLITLFQLGFKNIFLLPLYL